MTFEFPYKFVDKDIYEKAEDKKNLKIKDPRHIDKITSPEELSGLLNMALEGLKRILENNKFSYSKGTNEVKKFWVRKSDSFMAFCMDNIEESERESISKKDLRKAFHKYCKKHEVKGASNKSIKVTLEKMFGVSENREYDKDSGKTIRNWVGIEFKKDSKYKYVDEKLG